MKKLILTAFAFLIAATAGAQDYTMLDPKPYDPLKEPNIDMYISGWKNSMPHHTHGNLIERDILSPCTGDPMKPEKIGAVLTDVKRFSHGMLGSGQTTTPYTNKGEQEILYIDSGKGILKTKDMSYELHSGVGALIPPGIEYTIKSNDDDTLGMYIIVEPIPAGFTPRKEILVRDENILPVMNTDGHWCHIPKKLFWKDDGLAVLIGMAPVWYSPMTIGQPHSHGPNVEEIWFALDGDINFLLGKQLRKLKPGEAYKVPPDGKTPHSNINVSGEKSIKMFWFMKVAG